MRDRSPVILEVALNGVTLPAQNPAVPRAPGEVAEDALRCLAAGAAIIHSHSDEPVLPPEAAAERYLAAYRPILARRPDAILYPTIGWGADVRERYGHCERLAEAGAIRCAPVDTGSVNLGAAGADGLPPPMDFIYANSPNAIRHMLEVCAKRGLGPSVAVFEPGFLRVVLAAWRGGSLPPGTLVKFYFTSGGYLGSGEPIFGAPPIREAFQLYLAMLGDAPLPWAVAVIGGSLLDSEIAGLALARGGHLRVGLEDDMGGAGNLEQVERARRLCAEHGRRLASPDEAAALLGLPPQRAA
jgi:uncharacterized protein (DUF849 family)